MFAIYLFACPYVRVQTYEICSLGSMYFHFSSWLLLWVITKIFIRICTFFLVCVGYIFLVVAVGFFFAFAFAFSFMFRLCVCSTGNTRTQAHLACNFFAATFGCEDIASGFPSPASNRKLFFLPSVRFVLCLLVAEIINIPVIRVPGGVCALRRRLF